MTFVACVYMNFPFESFEIGTLPVVAIFFQKNKTRARKTMEFFTSWQIKNETERKVLVMKIKERLLVC